MNQQGHPGLEDPHTVARAGTTHNKGPHVLVRLLATLAMLAAVATYVATQVDFVRRHQPGISPGRYWTPQLVQIWLPGAAATALLGLCAYWLHRRKRAS